ncbi:MAG TPA: response regulator [Thermodesulfovibrionales bacterium]|nr:response regulator [Thermodesulfovibrionales bacterium]
MDNISGGSDSREKKRVLIWEENIVVNGTIHANALDISEDGMYIVTESDLPSGTVLNMAFKIHEMPIKVKAIVQHSQPGIGMGVKFIDLTGDQILLIRRYVNHMKEIAAKKAEKKVLLMDDDAQSRASFRSKLSLEGYIVIEATNGIETLKHLQDLSPDLVIMDLWMEGMDGFKILQLMQQDTELKDIPVIILSARTIPVDIHRATALGASECLSKTTTTPLNLVEKVRELFSSLG